MDTAVPRDDVFAAELPLRQDVFLRTLLRELAGVLQDVMGVDDASGFVSVVGGNLGRQYDADYRRALGLERLSREQVARVLVDLKRRVDGDFYVIEESDEKIVLGNRRCPFGEKVRDRPSLCMVTSNVFGSIASRNLGYAKVAIEQAIARGDAGCRVVIYLRPTPEAESAAGREYYEPR